MGEKRNITLGGAAQAPAVGVIADEARGRRGRSPQARSSRSAAGTEPQRAQQHAVAAGRGAAGDEGRLDPGRDAVDHVVAGRGRGGEAGLRRIVEAEAQLDASLVAVAPRRRGRLQCRRGCGFARASAGRTRPAGRRRGALSAEPRARRRRERRVRRRRLPPARARRARRDRRRPSPEISRRNRPAQPPRRQSRRKSRSPATRRAKPSPYRRLFANGSTQALAGFFAGLAVAGRGLRLLRGGGLRRRRRRGGLGLLRDGGLRLGRRRRRRRPCRPAACAASPSRSASSPGRHSPASGLSPGGSVCRRARSVRRRPSRASLSAVVSAGFGCGIRGGLSVPVTGSTTDAPARAARRPASRRPPARARSCRRGRESPKPSDEEDRPAEQHDADHRHLLGEEARAGLRRRLARRRRHLDRGHRRARRASDVGRSDRRRSQPRRERRRRRTGDGRLSAAGRASAGGCRIRRARPSVGGAGSAARTIPSCPRLHERGRRDAVASPRPLTSSPLPLQSRRPR